MTLSFLESRGLLLQDEGRALLALVLYQPTEESVRARAAAWARDPGALIFFALEGARPVGLCILRPSDGGMEIAALAVDPRRQRRGVGKALILHLRRHFRQALQAETDGDAVDFYRKCGFSVCSLGEKYPGVIRYFCILSQED